MARPLGKGNFVGSFEHEIWPIDENEGWPDTVKGNLADRRKLLIVRACPRFSSVPCKSVSRVSSNSRGHNKLATWIHEPPT